MNPWFQSFSLVISASLLSVHGTLNAQALSDVEEGQALAAELRSAQPPERLDVQGHILIRHSDRSRTTQPFWHQIIPGVSSWQLIYQAFPSDSAPGHRLVVTLSADQPPRYSLQTQTEEQGAEPDPVQLSGDEAMIPFAGSDFWLADLGLDFLHWPDQRMDRSTRITMRKGRACKILESRNPRPNAAGYTRVRSWVDNETGAILIAEAFGPDNRRMKEFEIGGFTRVDGRWELKNMEMRNLRDDTRTTLQFTY
jgi:hypothetical protein